MSLDAVIFFISAAVAVFGATMMITTRNPVGSVLYLLVSLVAQAVLFIQLGAMFLGLVLIVVYVGAILVLFLFVVMLLNLRSNEDLGRQSPILSRASKVIISVLLLVEIVFVIRGATISDVVPTGFMTATADTFGSVTDVAMLLFTTYLYPFELTGVLLLIAIVGAVVIAKRTAEEDAIQVTAPAGESNAGDAEQEGVK